MDILEENSKYPLLKISINQYIVLLIISLFWGMLSFWILFYQRNNPVAINNLSRKK